MVVPTIRNPNRYRHLQVAKLTKSQYHLEPDLQSNDYKFVGRRTKGGTGGGYIYSSGAYRNNDQNNTANLVVAVITMLVAFCLMGFCICFYCKRSDRSRNESHTDIRSTRNSVYRQRSQRAVAPNDTATIRTSNAIQFHTSPQVYNSPSGGNATYISPSGPIPERNVNMKPFFHFQTVLPDKSNLDPHVLREDAMMDHHTASDDDSIIGGGGDDPPGKRQENMHHSLSSRFLMSTWRRPTANDECSICLQSYQPGQSICLAKNTACKHVFHQDCIEEWLKNHSECPLCRNNILYRPP